MPFGKHLKDSRDLMILKRYQNTFMHKRRSVAEHMCSTAMIGQWLVVLENKLFNGNVDMAEVLQRAINHNITQSVTGNILVTTKELSKSMEDSLKTVRENAYNEYIDENIPKSWRSDYRRFCLNGKDDTIEGKILAAADIIDTMLECIEEINLGNVNPFKRILEETSIKLVDIDLNSVRYVLKYLLPSFGLRLEEYPNKVKIYISTIYFNMLDSELESYIKIGTYIYEYRNLMELLRYQNKFMYKRTSVVEHMWFVAKISQGLALWMERKFNCKVDMANVLLRALNHDVSERVTGDILSTTKRMTESMKHAIDEMEAVAFEEYIAISIPDSVLNEFKNYILHPKDDTIEGRILAAADILDTIFECADEVKLGNTEVFNGVLVRVSESLLNVDLEALDYFLKYSLEDIELDVYSSYGERLGNYIKDINL